jgi:ferredoxin
VKVRVDSQLCVGHGRCYEIAPEVFGDDERGHCLVPVPKVPAEHERSARRAEANCPERAIAIED